MSTFASALLRHGTVACVAPFKVVRRDATGAVRKNAVAVATACDRKRDTRRSTAVKARARTALDVLPAKQNNVPWSCFPGGAKGGVTSALAREWRACFRYLAGNGLPGEDRNGVA